MALIKVIKLGDEIVFEGLSEGNRISVLLADNQDKSAVFKVTNDFELPSYLKTVAVGEFLSFDVQRKRLISFKLSEISGRSAVLMISADRSIPIRHVRQQVVSTGN